MSESSGGELVLYKRWVLRPGRSVAQVADLVRREIVPRYGALSGRVSIGLEDAGDGSVVAVQRWSSEHAFRDAFSGDGFEAWWQAYEPVLCEWDALVEFVCEWETVVVVGPSM